MRCLYPLERPYKVEGVNAQEWRGDVIRILLVTDADDFGNSGYPVLSYNSKMTSGPMLFEPHGMSAFGGKTDIAPTRIRVHNDPKRILAPFRLLA
jgi:hypothetical protein